MKYNPRQSSINLETGLSAYLDMTSERRTVSQECMMDVTFVRIRIKAVELGVVDTGILLVVKRSTT